MRYALALAVPGLLFVRWMWRRWRDTTDRVPVSQAWLASDSYRRGCTGWDQGVSHTGQFKR